MKTILIVEDDLDIQELLVNYLETEGYKTRAAADGIQALSVFKNQSFDLVLLDLMLPKIDGYGVCEMLRQDSNVPIIMLTALDDEKNQIRGFDLQVDDYITKPFSMPLLLRKIGAVLRRAGGHRKNEVNKLVYRELEMIPDGYHLTEKGKKIELTHKEFELLQILLENQGLVLTRQMLLDRLWGYDYFGDERIVDTHVKNLRKKLDTDYITTIRGVGYRIDKEN